MKLKDVSKRIGMKSDYCTILKHNNPSKFSWLMSFDKCPVRSINKASDRIQGLKKTTQTHYYTFERDVDYSKWLFEKGFVDTFDKTLGRTLSLAILRDNPHYISIRFNFIKRLIKLEQIIEKNK